MNPQIITRTKMISETLNNTSTTFCILATTQKDPFMLKLAEMFKFSGYLKEVSGNPFGLSATIAGDKLAIRGITNIEIKLDENLYVDRTLSTTYIIYGNFLLISAIDENEDDYGECIALFLVNLDTKKHYVMSRVSTKRGVELTNKKNNVMLYDETIDYYDFRMIDNVVCVYVMISDVPYLFSTKFELIKRLPEICSPIEDSPKLSNGMQLCSEEETLRIYIVGKYTCRCFYAVDDIIIYLYSDDVFIRKYTIKGSRFELGGLNMMLYGSRIYIYDMDLRDGGMNKSTDIQTMSKHYILQ